MNIKNLIRKYELRSDLEDLDNLDIRWFRDNDFDLENVEDFKNRLKEYLILGFNGIYDFLGDWDYFEYSLEFYLNLFRILNELDNNYNNIIKELRRILDLENEWDIIEDILDNIKYNLLK